MVLMNPMGITLAKDLDLSMSQKQIPQLGNEANGLTNWVHARIGEFTLMSKEKSHQHIVLKITNSNTLNYGLEKLLLS